MYVNHYNFFIDTNGFNVPLIGPRKKDVVALPQPVQFLKILETGSVYKRILTLIFPISDFSVRFLTLSNATKKY